ncbi:MAG: adenylosuccinate lyase [Bacteriovoracales bacterium]|nr:adenylosuccinate lyase [Bacteriovoracales bacterium]
MIPRYEVQEMTAIWSDQSRFETYLQVELAVLKALGDEIPSGVFEEIEKKARVNPARIEEIEKLTRHDVIAFCTSITENLRPEIGKYFHYGVTSSDIIDTSLSLLMKKSSAPVLSAVKDLKTALWDKALRYKNLLAMGRSHGIYAEPFGFGQKFLGLYRELERRERDLERVYLEELTGQISGAVGNYTLLSRKIEEKALAILGLPREPLSTQVIPRDRIAKIISIHALTASLIERAALEIRHLHRSEVGEVYEGFEKGQRGSSTMPHKKNPISSENLSGMARILRSHVGMAMENCILWHERDISHSSTERLYLPDNFGLLVYSLRRLTKTLENLVVDEERIRGRALENFSTLSSLYLHCLIKHLDLTRDECYEIVQGAAFKAGSKEDFHNGVILEVEKRGLSVSALPSPNDLASLYLKEVEALYGDDQALR